MWRNASILIAVAFVLAFAGATQAARDVTGPLDFVVGVPDDGPSTDNTRGWPPNATLLLGSCPVPMIASMGPIR